MPKGLDHVIHFLNVVSSFSEIEEIVLIGGVLQMPFGCDEATKYLFSRLDKTLHNKVALRGAVPSSDVDALLKGGGYSLNFSRTEAFGYAFIEQMDAGLIPFTMVDAAMAEFYPDDLRELLLPSTFDLGCLREQYERIVAEGKTVHSRLLARTLNSPIPQRSRTGSKVFATRLWSDLRKRRDDRAIIGAVDTPLKTSAS